MLMLEGKSRWHVCFITFNWEKITMQTLTAFEITAVSGGSLDEDLPQHTLDGGGGGLMGTGGSGSNYAACVITSTYVGGLIGAAVGLVATRGTRGMAYGGLVGMAAGAIVGTRICDR
jgi:hypothetical protein